MKNLSNTVAEMKKTVTYKKERVIVCLQKPINFKDSIRFGIFQVA